MSNLIQNPGFEDGLSSWSFNNANLSSENAFEGCRTARMGPGSANLYQDIKIPSSFYTTTASQLKVCDFLLSYVIQAPLSFEPGDLRITVQYFNEFNTLIGTGFRNFISSDTTGLQLNWLTYIHTLTVQNKLNPNKIRILFSKDAGRGVDDVLDIDNVMLIKI